MPLFYDIFNINNNEGFFFENVRPEGIEPPSIVPKTTTLSIELWALVQKYPQQGSNLRPPP